MCGVAEAVVLSCGRLVTLAWSIVYPTCLKTPVGASAPKRTGSSMVGGSKMSCVVCKWWVLWRERHVVRHLGALFLSWFVCVWCPTAFRGAGFWLGLCASPGVLAVARGVDTLSLRLLRCFVWVSVGGFWSCWGYSERPIPMSSGSRRCDGASASGSTCKPKLSGVDNEAVRVACCEGKRLWRYPAGPIPYPRVMGAA